MSGAIAGAAAADGLFGLIGQGMANQANQNLAQDQANWNIDQQRHQQNFDFRMWNEMNRYNSPQAQMARFAEAGLNPHLIYGKGTPGNTTALKAPDIKPYNRAESKSVTEGLSVFSDYFRFKQLEAQTDNVEAQTNVANQTALLTGTKNLQQTLDFQKSGRTFETDISAAESNLEDLQNKARLSGNQADISDKTKQTQIDQIKQNLKNAINTGDLQTQQKAINEFELGLHKFGLTKSDPGWWRALATAFGSPQEMIKALAGIITIPNFINLKDLF